MITDTLQYVLHAYKYRSISELNAVLNLYHLRTITGRPGSRLNQYGGLLYQIVDEEGRGKGKPVKASAIPFQPTRKWLEERFEQNKKIDVNVIAIMSIDLWRIMQGESGTDHDLREALRRKGLAVAPDCNPEGIVTGMLLVNIPERTVVRLIELAGNLDLVSLQKKLTFDPLQKKIEREDRELVQRRQIKRRL